MYKTQLQNAIVDEMKICKILYTKIPHDKIDFRPKSDMRSIIELLQYLAVVGTALPDFWLNEPENDFFVSFAKKQAASRQMQHDRFLSAMDDEIRLTQKLFDRITDDEILNREVLYPWGGKAMFGEAIIASSVKFLTGYKLQLFLMIRMCTDQKLGTADAWFKTELD
ncbi:MAG TPA: hypothetical protein VKR32_06580 [Puia sp.]|nr:hypothetical protein [Puia sp.]